MMIADYEKENNRRYVNVQDYQNESLQGSVAQEHLAANSSFDQVKQQVQGSRS